MTQDEIRAQREKCADCGGQLQEVRVVQTGPQSVNQPLVFLSNIAKKNFWLGDLYPALGTVMAFKCSSCARISLYGAEFEKKKKESDGKERGKNNDH